MRTPTTTEALALLSGILSLVAARPQEGAAVHVPPALLPASFDPGSTDLSGSSAEVTLDLHPPVPGVAGQVSRLRVEGARPGAVVVTFAGLSAGAFSLSASCPGVNLWVGGNPVAALVEVADERGRVDPGLHVPRGAAGLQLQFQSLELGECNISDPLRFRIRRP